MSIIEKIICATLLTILFTVISIFTGILLFPLYSKEKLTFTTVMQVVKQVAPKTTTVLLILFMLYYTTN